MQEIAGRNNAQSLFNVGTIPSDTQIREVLDAVSPTKVFSIFRWCFDQLSKTGDIEHFVSDVGYLICLDGTQYFSSEVIHCKNCLTKTDKKTGKKQYYHTALTPVIVKPGYQHVLPLIPEFIIPQDGETKQDCELKAGKRWLTENTDTYGRLKATILGDDLYAHEPFCRNLLKKGYNFILVCKPDSHKTVYEWVKGITKERVEDRFDGKKHLIYTYNYAEGIPLKDSKDSLLVNFAEVTVQDRKTGKQLYHNAFVTNHPFTDETLPLIIDCGRARWKIENENNNTLKTKGYYFEHNFGHGKNHLSMILTTLILIAFLFHTILDLFSKPYQILIKKLGSRKEFFGSIRFLTRFFYCLNWNHLFGFMQQGLEELFPLPSGLFVPLPGG